MLLDWTKIVECVNRICETQVEITWIKQGCLLVFLCFLFGVAGIAIYKTFKDA